MNTIKDNVPFALTVSHCLKGSAGMTFPKSLGEKFDDAFDAGASPRVKVIRRDEKDTMLLWNMGANLADLSRLFGLSSTISKKPSHMIGLKNRGTLASLCFWQPDYIRVMSRDHSGNHIELTFSFREFITLLNTCHENYCDPRLLPNNFMKASDLTSKTERYFIDVFSNITTPQLQAETASMLPDATSKAPHFLIIAMEFGKAHDMFSKLDDFVLDSVSSYKLYHSNLLSDPSKNIMFELSGPFVMPEPNSPLFKKRQDVVMYDGLNLIELNSMNRVDLMMNNGFILASVDVGLAPTSAGHETILRVKLSISNKPKLDYPIFYITNCPTDGRYHGSQIIQNYGERWATAVSKGAFKMRLGFLSPDQEKEQMKQIGAGFVDSVDQLRGLCVTWNGRCLGPPSWRREARGSSGAGNWPAINNAGAIRAEILVEKNHYIIEDLMKVQSDKAQINIDEADSAVLRLVDSMVCHLEKNMLMVGKRVLNPLFGKKVNGDYVPYKDYTPDWAYDALYIIQHNELPRVPTSPPPPPIPPPLLGKLTVPINLAVSNVTKQSFTVTWQGGDNATSYTYHINDKTIDANSVGKSYTFTQLALNTEYSVSICAKKDNVKELSEQIKVKTASATAPPPPPAEIITLTTTGKSKCINVLRNGNKYLKITTFGPPEHLKAELEAMLLKVGPKTFLGKVQDIDLNWSYDA